MKTSDSTIFVNIASYRDPELCPTLHSLIRSANKPENLRIVICWQDDGDIQPFLDAGLVLITQSERLYQFSYGGVQLEVIAVDYLKSEGACWARYQVDKCYQQESYLLQIDSHCRFITGWDSEMIAMLESLREQSAKPVLSGYPPAYTPGKNEDRQDYLSRLVFNGFSKEGIVAQHSTQFTSETPIRSAYIAGGFIFADGHFVTHVPNDPAIFFIGEEFNRAMRAWTHGYDVWTPHRITLWHYYQRKNVPKVWDDHSNEAKEKGLIDTVWWQRNQASTLHVRRLLNADDTETFAQPWGLGRQRSLQEFQYRIGIDLIGQRVHPDIWGTEKVSWFTKLPDDQQEWLQSLRFFHDKTLSLSRDEINISRSDIVWWHIGVYSQDKRPVMLRRYSPEAFCRLITHTDQQSSQLTLRFDTRNSSLANTVRICAFTDRNEWDDVLEKSW
ncbi:Glycosyltransferase (GlcNAc) [Rosenbergiella nectarea]|uniref:Glycosyltransferase (GlcNAc) n=1 Tax=Rosenbergiella nectarea TaxID=988801 RepID=A0A1H9M8Z6_9GAMM|nr:GlcNAc-transferase family protein [Rosenbergiella nectarea]SER20240.1 Glycosyltransferase (GlcNAc) [Rosenbergiella nectarea]